MAGVSGEESTPPAEHAEDHEEEKREGFEYRSLRPALRRCEERVAA
jgi:hypothetical protein